MLRHFIREAIMSFKANVFGLLLPLAFLGASAQAADFFCNNVLASPHPQHFQCVQTTVGPGAPSVSSPDQSGTIPISASSVSAGSGFEASASVANASAAPGLVRGFASAEVFGGSSQGAQAVAHADAWFFDGGTVVGAAGVPIGTPVKLRFTLDVIGAFAGGTVVHALSEATVDLSVGFLINTHEQIDKFRPFKVVTYDVDARVGDSLEMSMKLHVSAGAINAPAQPGNANSVADVSNTGHLYVDVLSANASFIGASGHPYATPVVTGTTPQSITFGALTGKALGDAPFDVSATASSGLPLSFRSQTGSVCTVASVSVTLIATGTCAIRVSQAGNGTFAPAADVDQSFAVSASSSAVSITNSPAQPITGQAITFAVNVTGSSPGGSVTFTDNGGTIGTASVTNGTASLTVPSLSEGNHSIVAQYSGDANNVASNSAPLGFTVKAAPASSSGGSGGCSARNLDSGTDPLMPLMAFIALGWIVVRKRIQKSFGGAAKMRTANQLGVITNTFR
jgi:Bacterial Ig-like domain (group 3)